jgi:hypothetical protein
MIMPSFSTQLPSQEGATTSMAPPVLSSSTLMDFWPASVSDVLFCLAAVNHGIFANNHPRIVFTGKGCNGNTLGVSGGSCIERGQWNSFRLV